MASTDDLPAVRLRTRHNKTCAFTGGYLTWHIFRYSALEQTDCCAILRVWSKLKQRWLALKLQIQPRNKMRNSEKSGQSCPIHSWLTYGSITFNLIQWLVWTPMIRGSQQQRVAKFRRMLTYCAKIQYLQQTTLNKLAR